jgi:hypothetical protein
MYIVGAAEDVQLSIMVIDLEVFPVRFHVGIRIVIYNNSIIATPI